jgi:hypothetical protein
MKFGYWDSEGNGSWMGDEKGPITTSNYEQAAFVCRVLTKRFKRPISPREFPEDHVPIYKDEVYPIISFKDAIAEIKKEAL